MKNSGRMRSGGRGKGDGGCVLHKTVVDMRGGGASLDGDG